MRVVLCNAPPDVAGDIARAVVSEGLAACVNLLPEVRSVYVWEGTLHDEVETTLLIKVAADRAGALADRIRALHPYTTPEIVALDVDVAASDPDYVAWVRNVARNRGGP